MQLRFRKGSKKICTFSNYNKTKLRFKLQCKQKIGMFITLIPGAKWGWHLQISAPKGTTGKIMMLLRRQLMFF